MVGGWIHKYICLQVSVIFDGTYKAPSSLQAWHNSIFVFVIKVLDTFCPLRGFRNHVYPTTTSFCSGKVSGLFWVSGGREVDTKDGGKII